MSTPFVVGSDRSSKWASVRGSFARFDDLFRDAHEGVKRG